MPTIYSNWQTGLRIVIEYTQTKDIINNKSTISANYYLEAANGYEWYNVDWHDSWWQIDSSSGEWEYLQYDFRQYSRLWFKGKSYTVNHNADGTASKYFYADFYTGLQDYGCVSNVIFSQTVTLESIDRNPPTITAESVSISSSTRLNISITVDSNSNVWRYKLDNGAWVTFSSTAGLSATGVINVTAGTHTVQLSVRKSSNNVYGYGNIHTLDTVSPIVSFSVSDIETDGFTINATSDEICNDWSYSLNNGSTWTQFSNTSGKSASVVITGLSVNTQYQVKVKAKKVSNNLYGESNTQTVSTQGGIAHGIVNNMWKDVIGYIVVSGEWRRGIGYVNIGNSWRIGR